MPNDYKIEHWTEAWATEDAAEHAALEITVNDPAATRQTIIATLARRGYQLIERSSWHARSPHQAIRESHWDYQDIVMHHAGRSFSCGAPSLAEIQRAQREDMSRPKPFDDIGYHYAISCGGDIYEGRDIRYVGEHVSSGNTGKIGIVFLADFVSSGEAYKQEYSNETIGRTISSLPNIIVDRLAVSHDQPTEAQVAAACALSETLKEFFNITRLGGHREYQMIATGKGRACPGDLGMEIVEALRSTLRLLPPGDRK